MSEEELYCLRVRYVETGRLRYLSHLELLRAMERTIRRSGIPYAVTQGFSPRIKAAYCPALPVAVASDDEWFDLWVREYRPAEEYLEDLRRSAPPDLMPQQAAYVEVHGPSLGANLTIACWEADLSVWPDACLDAADAVDMTFHAEDVRRAAEAVRAQGQIEYLRNGKPKKVDLTEKLVGDVCVDPGESGGVHLSFTTRSSNEGALRPDVLLAEVCRQLAESLAVRGSSAGSTQDYVVSFQRNLRTSVVRTAQYLEGKDGTWSRPI